MRKGAWLTFAHTGKAWEDAVVETELEGRNEHPVTRFFYTTSGIRVGKLVQARCKAPTPFSTKDR